MEKVSQRTGDDCLICVLAMVMGPPYTYERVSRDSQKYRHTDDQGRFVAWFADYLRDEGFEAEHRPISDLRTFSDLASLPEGRRAMLVFRMPHLKINHVVAIDHRGIIDPQRDDNSSNYQTVEEFREIFGIEGWQLPYPNFWRVRKRSGVSGLDTVE
jgi:hypothetical protein